MNLQKILLTIALVAVIGVANAQNPKIKYQGDVQLGYSVGIGDLAIDRINIHTIHGVRIGQYFSTGLGVGLDYYHTYDLYVNNDYTASELSMPIFLNVKGYLPVSKITSLFLSMDIGASVGLTDGMDGMNGMLLTPAVGASFKVSPKRAITLSLGYNYQEWSESIFKVNTDALSIKVGFQF